MIAKQDGGVVVAPEEFAELKAVPGKLVKIPIDEGVIRAWLTTGTKALHEITHGLPPEARLVAAQMSTDRRGVVELFVQVPRDLEAPDGTLVCTAQRVTLYVARCLDGGPMGSYLDFDSAVRSVAGRGEVTKLPVHGSQERQWLVRRDGERVIVSWIDADSKATMGKSGKLTDRGIEWEEPDHA